METGMTRKCSLILIVLMWPALLAQPPDPGNYSKAEYTVRESIGHRVSMRDGITLSVDVYRPRAEGKFPGILSITPYDNTSAANRERARWFSQRGYVVAIADSRQVRFTRRMGPLHSQTQDRRV